MRSPRPRKTAELSKSLHRQLNSYALAVGAAGVGVLASSLPAQAKIVYIHANVHFRVNVLYSLNFNNETEFLFLVNGYASGGHGFYSLTARPVRGRRGVEGVGGKASALAAGSVIGPQHHFSGKVLEFCGEADSLLVKYQSGVGR